MGKVLGSDAYGQDYILSKEGKGPTSVLTGRQLGRASGTAAKPGYYSHPTTGVKTYWNGYGRYQVINEQQFIQNFK